MKRLIQRVKSKKKQGIDFEKRFAKITNSETIIGSGALWFAKGDVCDPINFWLFQCKTTKNNKYVLNIQDIKSLIKQAQDKTDGSLNKDLLWKPAFVVNFSAVNKTFILFPGKSQSADFVLKKSLTLTLEKLLHHNSLSIIIPECQELTLLLVTLENFLSNHHKKKS